MIRPSRHMMWMQMAKAAASRGTCLRLNVGAVITCGPRILSVGYNGAPSGKRHCDPDTVCDFHQPCTRAIHAEKNALEWVDWQEWGSMAPEMDIYTTASPCIDCANLIDYYGINRVFFDQEFRDTRHLQSLQADVYRLTPTGKLIDWRTKRVLDDSEI